MSAPVPDYHGIDIVNLNGLIVDIRERLSGGLTGNFYEKGGDIVKEGARHAQLPLLFKATAIMEILASKLEEQKQAAIKAAEDAKEAQKPTNKPNKSMMATFQEIIQTAIEAKTRTFAIESERMKVEVQTLKTQNARLVDDVVSLKAKVKKAVGPTASGSDEKYHMLNKKMDSMQKIQKQQGASHTAHTRDLAALRGAPPGRDGSVSTITISDLSEQLGELKSDVILRDTLFRSSCDTKVSKLEFQRMQEESEAGHEIHSNNAGIYERRHGWSTAHIRAIQNHLGLEMVDEFVVPDWAINDDSEIESSNPESDRDYSTREEEEEADLAYYDGWWRRTSA